MAASLGHLDIESAELLERGGSSLSAVSIWFSDPEAEVMSPSTAILDLQRQHENGSLIPADSYLIGALVHSLNQRNIQTVETAIDSDRTELIDQLQTLQFRVVDEGTCWTKTSQSAVRSPLSLGKSISQRFSRQFSQRCLQILVA